MDIDTEFEVVLTLIDMNIDIEMDRGVIID